MDVEHEDHKMKMLRIKTLLKVMFSRSVAEASGWRLVPGGGPQQPNYSRRVLAAQAGPAPHTTQHMMPST